MSCESSSALMLHQFELPHPMQLEKTYFRSKLFTYTSTANPLLAAAYPLFSILERFISSETLPPLHVVRDNIEHEWNAFRSHLSSLRYAHECAVVAEYIMSSTLDELLGKTYLRDVETPIEFIAFTPASNQTKSHFFELINYMKERANQYLDVLELAYYCLVSGYEGTFYARADGRQALDNLIQELYELISNNRSHKAIKLFKDFSLEIKPHHTTRAFAWKPALIGLVLCLGLLLSSQYLLELQTTQILNAQQSLVYQDAS